MKAILLCAGVGRRLEPVTHCLPKCMVPINGVPLLAYWLNALIAAGIDSILINTHHRAGMICDWVSKSPYKNHVTVVHETELIGTAGTVLENRRFINGEPFMLIHADNLSCFDLTSFAAAHARRPDSTLVTMMTFVSPTPETCGIVRMNEQKIISEFHEKVKDPPGNLANAAVYIVEPEVVDTLLPAKKASMDFSCDVLPDYLDRIFAFHNDRYHRDIGTLDSYLLANLEYPYKSINAGDAWTNLCRFDGNRLIRCLADVLSMGLGKNTTTARTPEVFENIVSSGLENQIVVLHEATDDMLAVLERKAGNPQDKKPFIIFESCPEGFSSAGIFKRYGFESVAVCQA